MFVFLIQYGSVWKSKPSPRVLMLCLIDLSFQIQCLNGKSLSRKCSIAAYRVEFFNVAAMCDLSSKSAFLKTITKCDTS